MTMPLTVDMFALVLLPTFVMGASIGSFLNVCIARWPAELSVVKPRSRCPKCARQIAWHENIPVLSWLRLARQVRGCQLPISTAVSAVELLVALGWVACAIAFGFTFEATRVAIFGTILLGIAVTDAKHYLIPDGFTISGLVFRLGTSVIAYLLLGRSHAFCHTDGRHSWGLRRRRCDPHHRLARRSGSRRKRWVSVTRPSWRSWVRLLGRRARSSPSLAVPRLARHCSCSCLSGPLSGCAASSVAKRIRVSRCTLRRVPCACRAPCLALGRTVDLLVPRARPGPVNPNADGRCVAHRRSLIALLTLSVSLAACESAPAVGDGSVREASWPRPSRGSKTPSASPSSRTPVIETRSKEQVREFLLKQLTSERASEQIDGQQRAFKRARPGARLDGRGRAAAATARRADHRLLRSRHQGAVRGGRRASGSARCTP